MSEQTTIRLSRDLAGRLDLYRKYRVEKDEAFIYETQTTSGLLNDVVRQCIDSDGTPKWAYNRRASAEVKQARQELRSAKNDKVMSFQLVPDAKSKVQAFCEWLTENSQLATKIDRSTALRTILQEAIGPSGKPIWEEHQRPPLPHKKWSRGRSGTRFNAIRREA